MFSLDYATDLLKKCEHDIFQLSYVDSHPEYDYAMFDAVVSLNHLFEWYLKDKSIEEQKRLDCISLFNPFQTPYDVSSDFKQFYKKFESFPDTNKIQYNIRQLCNKAKHFKKTEIEIQLKDISAVAGSMCAGGDNAYAGYFKKYKYSIEIDGSIEDLQSLIEQLLAQWVEFCK